MVETITTDSTVAVIGLGLMGSSIAACLLSAGHRVIGVTDNIQASADVPSQIGNLMAEMARAGYLDPGQSPMDRFVMTAELNDVCEARVVFESITEDLQLKRSLFKALEAIVSSDCVLATNTSGIPVSLLQEGAKHPGRILAVHWDDPAHVKRFLEIAPGPETFPDIVEAMVALAVSWGKQPAVLRREIRGFIVNRISYAMFREACHLVDSGVCTVEDVDRAMRTDVGWWMPLVGPFRYMDLMGVAAYYRVMPDLLPDLTTDPDIPKLMRGVVEGGGLGIKNGRGFYSYSQEEAKHWESRFREFNYRMRRLTDEFADMFTEPPPPPDLE
jgi:3-hydroxybutyryl-CoA dehydrogenase